MQSSALRSLIFISALLLSSFAFANVTLPVLLSDGVVLQRGLPIHIWGKADPGESVSVTLNRQTKSTTADITGRWHLYLAPESAGGPYELDVKGHNQVSVHDVLIGDVWIASGQSNMEYPMEGWGGTAKDQAEEIPKANLPTVRLLIVEHAFSDHPLDDLPSASKWQSCTPETARKFSAVGYYFAKEISARERVPLGVIESNWGGTPAEAWTSLDALGGNANLVSVFAHRAHMMDSFIDEYMMQPHEEQLKREAREKGLPEPKFSWHPDPNSWTPAALYNAMISPLTLMPIRGVIWYQGESNSLLERGPLYGTLFQTMIRDWRQRWGVGDFPFLYVQISSFKSDAREAWPNVREGQRETLTLANTGMAVTIDIGNPDDVHPTDKKDVGHRLALVARDITYGEHVEDSGPLFREVTRDDHGLRLWFDHAEGGFKPGAKGWCEFEVAAVEGEWSPATTRVEGSTIIVANPAIQSPSRARYAWQNSPSCYFFNQADLPASPFTAILPLYH